MSCFGAAADTTSGYYPSSAIGGGRRPWRWWRAKCAGIAAAVGSRIRKSIKKGIDGRRRRRAVHAQRGCCRRSSFAPVPVYVDELYGHHHHPPKPLLRVARPEPPTTTIKPTAAAAAAPPVPHAARATGGKATARIVSDAAANKLTAAAPPVRHAAGDVAHATGGKATAADAAGARRGVPARVSGAAVASTAAAGVGAAMRNVLLRSPGKGGGGVLGVVKGMGEVDLRAELFIRKFKEDIRLQSQRSAEEFQAMLARGL
ncbi:unnamed protein product [Urochloa decumbens]|uniref:Uncharacterized protein n=1 Tax=Urochloa decumbens TaxID=240449 RepID=A0ABC9BNP3_9POAL